MHIIGYRLCQRFSCGVHGHRPAAVISRLRQSERTLLANQLLSVENLEGNIMATHQLFLIPLKCSMAMARLWPYSCADFEGGEVPPFC